MVTTIWDVIKKWLKSLKDDNSNNTYSCENAGLSHALLVLKSLSHIKFSRLWML